MIQTRPGQPAFELLSRRTFVKATGFAAAGLSLGWSGRAPDLHAMVLGTAQDGGMPQAGCYTPACEAARSADDPYFVASLALLAPKQDRFYLIDASPDLVRQLDLIPYVEFRQRAANRRPFDGIFLTHAHIGHYLGLAMLGREGVGISSTACWCTPRMASFLATNGPWSLMVEEGRLDLRPMTPGRQYTIDDQLVATAIDVPHRDEYSDTVGFLFEGPAGSLFYLPDVDRWGIGGFDLEAVVERADVALLDGSFFSAAELPGREQEDIPHPLIPDTMARLQSRVDRGGRVVFTHLNNSNPVFDPRSEERRKVIERGFEIAREGDTFDL